MGGHPAERTAAVLAATRNAVPARVQLLTSPGGILCNPPPWGTLAAVDLTSGDVRWEVPLGRTPELSAVPEARHWGSPNYGGTLTTAGGLVFIAAARDTALRAFDVETGTVLWEADLPTSAQATPMTYRSASGKQFVVIAAGATRGSGPTAAITSRSRCREARGACIRLKVMPYHTALASTSSLRGAIIPG